MRPTSSSFALGVLLCVGLSGLPSWTAAEAASQAAANCRRDPASAPIAPRDAIGEALFRGNEALRQGRDEEALEAYEKSARLARAAGSIAPALIAEANAVRAALESEPTEAVASRLEALESALGQPDETTPADGTGVGRRLRARLSIHLARSWERLAAREPADGAARARKRAAALLSAAEALALEVGDEHLVAYALGYRGGLYLGAARLDEARTLTRRALLVSDRLLAYDALFRWHAQLSRIERQAERPDAALAAARRAVAALALARADPARVLDLARGRFEEEVEPVYLELVDLILERSKSVKDPERQRLLSEARDTLEGLKADEVRDYFEDACLAAQRTVAPDDVAGAAVLYPILLADRLELILGERGTLSLYTVQMDREELEQQARMLRRTLPDRTFRGYRRSAATLYDALIRPVEAKLAEAEVLVVIPSGPLRQIPFAALYDLETREHLIEKIAVASTPGLSLTDPRSVSPEAAQALAAGVSEAVQGYIALDVRAEIEAVGETFSSVVLLDRDFTAARFEKTIETRPVSVVHIASHGEFRPESAESFVLTYAGKLSMNRLAQVIGRTRLRAEEPLELLVLSACETAAGDDRSALGLAGVALQSGARSAVATLWSVSDQATGLLMTRFYAEVGRGRSRAAALRAAQLSLLTDPSFSHPTYWSPFLMIGSWL